VNSHEAKTTLSKLIERVEQGEEIVIARNGKPVARPHARRVQHGDRARRRPSREGSAS
jgi:antitoxin (DNA-binding transcriptional repressor) of toxin-antitoxin stability system